MKLNTIRIVLVATSHPGNIGATARAMKNMGLERLVLVAPKHFPDVRAYEMAAGADDVLHNAVVVGSLEEAIADCHLVMATSARPRGISLPGMNPAENALFLRKQSDTTEVAIVFGREHAGLTNEELLKCHYHITIPSNPEYSSLNLSQAVQVVTYELRSKWLEVPRETRDEGNELATMQEVEQFYAHLESVLVAIEFLKLSNPKRLSQRLRRLFNRVKLEKMEVNILRGILTHMQHAIKPREG